MSYSQQFKINVNKLNSDEMLLVLAKITHPYLTEPVRIINDTKDFELLGENYLAMPFEIKRQDDVQGELPKVNFTISNIGRSLIKWIDSSGGGRDAKIEIILARRSQQLVEESIVFGISSVSVTTQTISFNLVVQNNLVKKSIRWVYDMNHAPGLF